MSGDFANIPWFYAVPLLFFGPIFLLVFYNFGIKLLFQKDTEGKALRKQQRELDERIEARRARKVGAISRKDHGATRPSLVWGLQAAFFAGAVAVVGVFSNAPSYSHMGADTGLIRLSISHPGQRKEPCVKRTREEMAELAPNMRISMKCSRERWPIEIEVDINGERIFQGSRNPAGLSGDMASSFYERFVVKAGEHRITVRMRDDGRENGFAYSLSKTLTISPAQSIVIGFREDGSGLFIH